MREGEQIDYDQYISQTALRDSVRNGVDSYNFQRWLLDDRDDIAQLQLSLRGIKYDAETGKYVEYPDDRLMSDAGARKITETFLTTILREARITNLTEEYINSIMESAMEMLNDHFFEKWQAYGMKWNDVGFVLELIEEKLFLTLNRSLDGAEQERLGSQKVISEERYNQAALQKRQQPEVNDRNILNPMRW